MKVIVFGANGRVGQLVVDNLLHVNHTVIAVIHGADPFEPHNNLRVVQADIYKPEQYIEHIKGCDAVISTLGSWGTPRKDIVSTGMRHIVPAMQQYGVNRIVSLTGADARAKGDKITLLHRLGRGMLLIIAKKIILDGERHVQILSESDLDWTVIRSPVMQKKGKLGFIFSVKRPYPWQTIYRQNVANAMVALLEEDAYIQQAPFLHGN